MIFYLEFVVFVWIFAFVTDFFVLFGHNGGRDFFYDFYDLFLVLFGYLCGNEL